MTEGNNPRISKPANKERQKARKLENTVKQQENVIKNLEKSLRDYLDRAGRFLSIVRYKSYCNSGDNLMSVECRMRHDKELYKFLWECEGCCRMIRNLSWNGMATDSHHKP